MLGSGVKGRTEQLVVCFPMFGQISRVHCELEQESGYENLIIRSLVQTKLEARASLLNVLCH